MAKPKPLAGYCRPCQVIIIFQFEEAFSEQYFCPVCASRIVDRARKEETLKRRYGSARLYRPIQAVELD